MIDYKKYGSFNIRKWMEQGKYNLNPEELKIRRLQIEIEYQRKLTRLENKEYLELCKELDLVIAAIQYDFRETEAVKHWRKVHYREMQYRWK